MCHFRLQNGYFKKSSVKTINITFIYLLTPFSVQNFKSIIGTDPELRRCIFEPKMVSLPQARIFWEKSFILFSSTYWPLSLWKLLKNSYSGSRVLRMDHFRTQYSPLSQTRIFSENLLINLVHFIHAYLHFKNQSLISIF